jgi:hypothetical protein
LSEGARKDLNELVAKNIMDSRGKGRIYREMPEKDGFPFTAYG